MTKAVKTVAIILTSALVLGGCGYLALRQFTKSIYNQRTCDWANIDNIELHAEVNIPKITSCDCLYKKEQNTKMARFDIDTGKVDMDRYIKRNHFKKLKPTDEMLFDELLINEDNPADIISSSALYYTKGSYDGETWLTLLDHATGRLWVTIRYND